MKDKCTQQGPRLAGVEGRHSGWPYGKAGMDLEAVQVVNMESLSPWEWTCSLQPSSLKKTSLLTGYRSRKAVKAKGGEMLTLFVGTCIAELSIVL